jgi:hypothetical protein
VNAPISDPGHKARKLKATEPVQLDIEAAIAAAPATKSKLHLAALSWAVAGFAVFPCREGRKEPACPNGHKDATTDPAKIDAFWAENPNYNVGCTPAVGGNSVLDVDPPQGFETLAQLESEHGKLPPSLTISTPRGGIHWWGDGTCATSASKLGPKLDTRSHGGYVLMPPSVIGQNQYENNPSGGTYAVKSNNAIATLPAWISASLAAERSSVVAGTDKLDLPANIGRVRQTLERYVEAGDVAIEGNGGDARTFRLCCEVLDLGVSPDKAAELILELWNPHCRPEWSGEELQTKIENAANYRQNEIGAYAVKDPAEAWPEYLASAPDTAAKSGELRKRSRFYPLDSDEQDGLEEPKWIIPQLLQKNSLAVGYGKPKSFKSFLVLHLTLGIATGEETFGFKPEPLPVVYCAGEGANNIARKHRPAWLKKHGIAKAPNFYIIPCVPKAATETDVEEMIEQIKARGIHPGVVVIDTMARSVTGMEENSAKDIGRFVEKCDLIRETFGCTVIVIHHSGKNAGRGSRGSNALQGAVDTELEVVRHEKTGMVAVYVREQRNAQERKDPYRFEGKAEGGSLVFETISEEDFKKGASKGVDPFSDRQIGLALYALRKTANGKAATPDHPLKTAVLANQLRRMWGQLLRDPVAEADANAGVVDSLTKRANGTGQGASKGKRQYAGLYHLAGETMVRGGAWFISDSMAAELHLDDADPEDGGDE